MSSGLRPPAFRASFSPRSAAMAPAAADGWDPAWDEPEAAREQHSSWEAFFADSVKRADKAMRDAGIDPRKCVALLLCRVARTPRCAGDARCRAVTLCECLRLSAARRAALRCAARALTRARGAQGRVRRGQPQRRCAAQRDACGRARHVLGLRRALLPALRVRRVPGDLPRPRHQGCQRLCAHPPCCAARRWRRARTRKGDAT